MPELRKEDETAVYRLAVKCYTKVVTGVANEI